MLELQVLRICSDLVSDETTIVLHYQCTTHAYMGNAVQTNSNVVNTNYPILVIRDTLNVTGVSTFVSDIYIDASLYDNNDSNGTNGQLLISTGTGIQWSNLDGSGSGTAIAAGQNIFEQQIGTPYYITASDVTTGISTGGFIDTTIVSKDGNIGIGSTQPTAILDVNGTLNVTGVSTFTGDANFDNGTLYVDSANNRIGIGTNAPSTAGLYVADIRGPILIGSDTVRQLAINGGSISQSNNSLTLYGGGMWWFRTWSTKQ